MLLFKSAKFSMSEAAVILLKETGCLKVEEGAAQEKKRFKLLVGTKKMIAIYVKHVKRLH